MAKTTYSREELEQQLSESRREFWAADATINNLELKLAEMAEKLANAEKRIAELESLTEPQLPQPAVAVPLAIHDEDFEKALSVLNDTLDDCGDSERGLLLALDKAGIEVRSDACRAAMLHGAEPVTDNTNQQFESLSRGDK